MPVEGDSNARVQCSCGSSASASSRESSLQVVHAVGQRAPLDHLQLRRFSVVVRHDQLAAAPVMHAVRRAVVVQQRLAAHAQQCAQRAGRVVDAGVDDLAVACAGHGAEGVFGLEHDHLAAGLRERARAGQADHAGTDHDTIDPLRRHRGIVAAARDVGSVHFAANERYFDGNPSPASDRRGGQHQAVGGTGRPGHGRNVGCARPPGAVFSRRTSIVELPYSRVRASPRLDANSLIRWVKFQLALGLLINRRLNDASSGWQISIVTPSGQEAPCQPMKPG